jgi:hypothetical protein
MSLLAVGNRRSRRVHRTASLLTAGSRQRRWVNSLAPRPIDLGDNDEHEDRKTDIHTPSSIQRDGYGIICDHWNKKKLITQNLGETMRWSYSWKEILNDGPCAMNLTNSFKTLSNKIEDVYQTKLKTDSQNGFISSRCIFLCRARTMVMLTRTPRHMDIRTP